MPRSPFHQLLAARKGNTRKGHLEVAEWTNPVQPTIENQGFVTCRSLEPMWRLWCVAALYMAEERDLCISLQTHAHSNTLHEKLCKMRMDCIFPNPFLIFCHVSANAKLPMDGWLPIMPWDQQSCEAANSSKFWHQNDSGGHKIKITQRHCMVYASATKQNFHLRHGLHSS